MAKNQTTGNAHRRIGSEKFAKRGTETGRVTDAKRSKGNRREILFPTEPTSIPHEEIDRAIDLVI